MLKNVSASRLTLETINKGVTSGEYIGLKGKEVLLGKMEAW